MLPLLPTEASPFFLLMAKHNHRSFVEESTQTGLFLVKEGISHHARWDHALQSRSSGGEPRVMDTCQRSRGIWEGRTTRNRCCGLKRSMVGNKPVKRYVFGRGKMFDQESL